MSKLPHDYRFILDGVIDCENHVHIVKGSVAFNGIKDALQQAIDNQWQTIESCPASGKIWVYGGVMHPKPELVLAEGGFWRSASGLSLAPKFWMPFNPPKPPETK